MRSLRKWLWAAGDGDCKAHTLKSVLSCAGKQKGGAARAKVDGTATADTSCPCAVGTFAKDAATNCVAKTTCGNQLAVGTTCAAIRGTTTAATLTADTVCGACAAGTSAATGGDDCTTTPAKPPTPAKPEPVAPSPAGLSAGASATTMAVSTIALSAIAAIVAL